MNTITDENKQTEPQSTAQHTPGPWRISGSCFVKQSPDKKYFHELIVETHDAPSNRRPSIATVNARAYVDTPKQALRPDKEAEANARLIAAAPELLEELEQLVGFLDRYPHQLSVDISGYLDSSRAAIAKVKGGAQ